MEECKKRVELHAHSKMTKELGLASVREYFMNAVLDGMVSMAINDFNSVQSYDVIKRVSKLYPRIKPIFGLEVCFLDSSHQTHFANILAKNSSGITNINKLLTSVLDNDEVANLSDILKNRKNLLIGYSFLTSEQLNYSEDELCKIINEFDFVEVLPPSSYDTYATEEIIKVLKLSESLNKKCVAVSNSYYIEEEKPEFVYKFIEEERFERLYTDGDLSFKNTNRMLEEFEFLPFDKAHEIVIDNTHVINDLIEWIKFDDPKHLIFSDDSFKDSPLNVESIKKEIEKIVNDNLHKLYGKNPNQLIIDRINEELEIINENNYTFTFYLHHLIINKAIKNKECFKIRDLAVNGYDLKEQGLEGIEIGKMLNTLLEKVIQSPELNNKEALLNFVKNFEEKTL
jgi:DNA polymerase-3 subunit alpha (Gram-positive type)